ncbi:MAG: sodium:solute symporter [Cytophagales bacterium]|nr:MAG: sodium:solute symporter [Cytophagales bacterium]
MSSIDWVVLLVTLSFIVVYGTLKTRKSKNLDSYLLADKKMKWWAICLSIMGTQASAITFLSVPGQAYEDGMRFLQFYFGLPLAMIVISITVVPIYARLKVYTAYEYLEHRFDLKTRTLASVLFLIQRGLSTGITIYAPAIVLSSILDWSVNFTILIIGGLVIIYTFSGGVKAVSVTQNLQMAIIVAGMFTAGYLIVHYLPTQVGFLDAINIAGELGKMNTIDFNFDWNDRYNFWSGITGGFFLALSYFGTDQSQVGRYLGGANIAESRMGLLFNGLLKIPMQFLILLLGVLLFVFYQFYTAPLFFNQVEERNVKQSVYADEYFRLEKKYEMIALQKQQQIELLSESIRLGQGDEKNVAKSKLQKLTLATDSLRDAAKKVILKAQPSADTKDSDYIFISFILSKLPKGVVGLLLAVIFCAAMSSTSAGLNSLAATSSIDIYKRLINISNTDKGYVDITKLLTIFWGLVAIGFAFLASMVDNLIQAVNILGSLFYGTILGIFLVAFYFKKVGSNAVFIGALISQFIILVLYFYSPIAFLWYNVIGCFLVIVMSSLVEELQNANKKAV